MPQTPFRNGQWVRFDMPYRHPGVYSPGGRHTGIHVAGFIHPVDKDGRNLPAPDSPSEIIRVPLAEAGDVQPLLDRAHIPPARRKTLHPGWVPTP